MTAEDPSSTAPRGSNQSTRAKGTSIFQAYHRLLRDPAELVSAMSARPGQAAGLLVSSLVAFAIYGAGAGLFQGGSQVAVSAFKVPLIVLGSWLICLPSFYVFTALAGTDYPGGKLLSVIVSAVGVQALVLLALLPISWLFSVSSRSLLFVVLLHASVWVVAVIFARRLLTQALPRPLVGPLLAWTLLFAMVAFQMTTYLRPVLWRMEGDPLFTSERLFFVEHLARSERVFHNDG